MSKFSDKLARLHASRVRALEADDQDAQQRVFVAEPAVAGEPPATPPQSRVDTPARTAVREQLERGAKIGAGKTRRKPRVTMQREQDRQESPVAHSEPPSHRIPPSQNAVGERLTDLRLRAEALIAVGGLESSLPLLHEMAALSPTHPYPLAQLAEYWRSAGNNRLADLYMQRLAAIAPY